MLAQAHGRTQAVRPVAAQMDVQMPFKTTHAAPGPHSSWQSLSLLQNRQCAAGPSSLPASPQKAAFPVVSKQLQLELVG